MKRLFMLAAALSILQFAMAVTPAFSEDTTFGTFTTTY